MKAVFLVLIVLNLLFIGWTFLGKAERKELVGFVHKYWKASALALTIVIGLMFLALNFTFKVI